MTSVLLADDHVLVRAGMRRILADEPSIVEIGEAASGTETLTMMRRQFWDLLVLDISMPHRGGLDILPHLRSGFPETRILAMTMFGERQYARFLLRAGVNGFVKKDASHEELLDAVRTVLAGRRYVSPDMADVLVSLNGDEADSAPHEGLTERELQIMLRIAEGKNQPAIAAELCIAPKTVSGYRARILKRLNLESDAQLTIYAIRNGLIV